MLNAVSDPPPGSCRCEEHRREDHGQLPLHEHRGVVRWVVKRHPSRPYDPYPSVGDLHTRGWNSTDLFLCTGCALLYDVRGYDVGDLGGVDNTSEAVR